MNVTEPRRWSEFSTIFDNCQSRELKRKSGEKLDCFRFSRKRQKAEKSPEISRFDFLVIGESKQ